MRAVIILLCVVSIVLAEVDSRIKLDKRRLKRMANSTVNVSCPLRPQHIPDQTYCSICRAVVIESLQELRGKKSEGDVFQTLSEICHMRHYSIYESPPADMRDACKVFIADWEETLEGLLIHRQKGEDLVQIMCHELTKSCVNVKLSKMRIVPDTVNVDGTPVFFV